MTDTTTTNDLRFLRAVKERRDGLDALVTFVGQHPDLPVPKPNDYKADTWLAFAFQADVATAARYAWMLAPCEKRYTDNTLRLTRRFGPITFELVFSRADVCEKRVTTETVTTLVPAPDAPMIEVVEEVEHVEWTCAPILAATDGAA